MFCDYVSIHSQEEMAPGIYRMVLEAPAAAAAAAPGQFVNLYVNNPSMLLPRPISICEADPETGLLTLIYAVVGHGTDELAGYTAGTRLRLMGPLGNGFPMERAGQESVREILLVGGGLGIPPMLFLARKLHELYPEKGIRIFNGFRSKPWIEEEFMPYGEIFNASDDGRSGFMGNVIDAMEYKMIFTDENIKALLYTCGPLPMMRAIQKWQQGYNMETWFSLEERMGCGFGACAGCPAKLRMPDGSVARKGVCKMGPVFPGEDVIFE